jgi:predicted Rossmann fold nucleotide-binding protein DprA/Smf involved in DNA uptake
MKILSGGQTGVDRAALDFALKNSIVCGGWCPKWRIAEDGRIPEIYPLKEASSKSYSWRTELNVRDSDATLVISSGKIRNGTELTIKIAAELGKPVMIIDLDRKDIFLEENFNNWLAENNVEILNIAGPRESSRPGIYEKSLKILEELL